MLAFAGALLLSLLHSSTAGGARVTVFGHDSGILDTATLTAAIEDAVDYVNEAVLNGTCQLILNDVVDAQCNVEIAQQRFYEELEREDIPVAIVGGGCSVVTETIAPLAYDNEIPLISYHSPSLSLDNIEGLYRTIPSDINIPSSIESLMNHFDWTRIAIIAENTTGHYSLLNKLESVLLSNNIDISDIVYYNDTNIAQQTDKLLDSVSHIFFISGGPQHVATIMCKAVERDKVYPNYAWIIPEWYDDDWYEETGTGCSDEDIRTAINKTLVLQTLPAMAFYDRTNIPSFVNPSLSPLTYAVDAILALAVAINSSINNDVMHSNCSGVLSYDDIRAELTNAEFPGVTVSHYITSHPVISQPRGGVSITTFSEKSQKYPHFTSTILNSIIIGCGINEVMLL